MVKEKKEVLSKILSDLQLFNVNKEADFYFSKPRTMDFQTFNCIVNDLLKTINKKCSFNYSFVFGNLLINKLNKNLINLFRQEFLLMDIVNKSNNKIEINNKGMVLENRCKEQLIKLKKENKVEDIIVSLKELINLEKICAGKDSKNSKTDFMVVKDNILYILSCKMGLRTSHCSSIEKYEVLWDKKNILKNFNNGEDFIEFLDRQGILFSNFNVQLLKDFFKLRNVIINEVKYVFVVNDDDDNLYFINRDDIFYALHECAFNKEEEKIDVLNFNNKRILFLSKKSMAKGGKSLYELKFYNLLKFIQNKNIKINENSFFNLLKIN